MNLLHDRDFVVVISGVLGMLVLSSLIGQILKRRVKTETAQKVIANLNARTKAWWIMCIALFAAMATGGVGSIILFACTSFLALREFITLTPTRPADHRTLFWAFFIFTPVHYYLLWTHWYGLFSIFIPVYAFLFIPLRSAMAGDTENFLARTSMIQWALMLCVYCVSHAPALLMLQIPGFEGQNIKLLMFLILIAQLSDVFQYVFGKTLGKHKVAPHVSPNKTWEGLIGGVGASVAVGTGLWWITPFNIWQAALISLAICLAGFAGGLCMSAIKRDRGIKDFGTLIEGHGGMLDRIDSICFAAPIYFHIIRYFFTV
jgi:phosphatidate cytidylyltransferase